MSLIVGAKVKGEGLTTAVQALSLVWPANGPRVVAEFNPSGGDLALRYGLLEPPNLVSLAAEDESCLTAEHLPSFFQSLGGPVSLLLAPPSAEQTQAALGRRWVKVARVLASLPGDALVDAGTLTVPAQANTDVLACADVGVLVVRPTLDAVVHLLRRLPGLPAPRAGLVVLVVGEGPVTAKQIGQESGLPVVGELPWDPDGAKMLMAGRWSERALRHSRLLRWSVNAAEALVAVLASLTPTDRGAPAVSTPASGPDASGPGSAVKDPSVAR